MRTRSATTRDYLAAIVLVSLCAASSAHGQSTDRDLDQEARANRQSATSNTDSHSAGTGFELIVSAPLLYTNFATQIATDELLSRKGDAHFYPDVALKWSHQFDWLKLSVGVDLAMDRYLTQKSANEDTINSGFKAAFTDGKSDLFVPYVSYASWVDFLPLFGRHDDTLQDFAAGFTSSIGLNGNGSVIPYKKATQDGDAYIRFDARIGQRIADPRDYENKFVSASVQFGYVVNRELEVSISPMVKAKWYDDYFGDVRRDVNVNTLFLVAWTPPWLKDMARGAEIDFTATIERNFSNLAEKNYTRWEAGPGVVFRVKF